MWADEDGAWLYTEVRDLAADVRARYQVLIGSDNDFVVQATRNVEVLAFDVLAMGLDPTLDLVITADTADATQDVLVLEGYATSPSDVLEGTPSTTWSYDRLFGEVRIEPATFPALITVVP
jgi:hypothetical protein